MSDNADRSDKPTPDWGAIEVEWRAGALPVRQIAANHGITHPTILGHFKRRGILRGTLKHNIQAKADALVARAMTAEPGELSEEMTVEAEARIQARVRLAHRQVINRCRVLVTQLAQELEDATEHKALVEQMREALMDDASDDAKQSMESAWRRIMSLPARANTAKTLVETMRVLIDKEREAYSIGEGPPPNPHERMTDEDLIAKLALHGIELRLPPRISQ
jgi:uncharacterized protein YbcI